tara:strand:- start:1435 stop:2568 length:1134 start_codon:yes stop_codon:yes gene_type:complete
MKILFITGSRGEWGYIKPIIKLCIKRSIDYDICATNMLLLPNFGNLVEEIKDEGFKVSDEIFMALDGYNHFSTSKSLGIFLSSFSDVVKRLRPTWILLAGDRGEQLMASICGAYTYTPVAHVQAGERSGNIDGLSRHAIGKFVNIHFAANSDAFNRLISLGEERFRVHNVGAPQLDEIYQGEVSSKKKLEKNYNFSFKKKYLLTVLHPVTEELKDVENQVEILIKSLKKINLKKIWVCPNNDAGNFLIKNKILEDRDDQTFIFENLTRKDFLGFLKFCSCIVGNSSAGLLEAPSFKKPAINIGRRQNLRVRGKNVLDCSFTEASITKSVKIGVSENFNKKLKLIKNPYGNGRSAEKILNILQNTKINDKLLIKTLTI